MGDVGDWSASLELRKKFDIKRKNKNSDELILSGDGDGSNC